LLTIKPKPLDNELYNKWFKDNSSIYEEYPDSGPGVPLRIKVLFNTDTLGNILRPVILRGIGFGFDEEALRLVKRIPTNGFLVI
jgi:hypothetical protein